MHVPEVAQNAVEKFRIDPAGFAFVGAGLVAGWFAGRDETSPAMSAMASAAGIALISGGLTHLDNMFSYSRDIEATLEDIGFQDAQFRVRAYCLRQASRVICQMTGDLEEYEDLCRSTSGKRFTFLPHL